MKKLLILFQLFLFSISAFPQKLHPNTEQIIESLVETISEESNIDSEQLLIDLYFFAENPISINHATTTQLRQLHLLSEFQIAQLLNYINQYGQIISVHELQAIKGFTAADKERLAPFITIQKPESNTMQPKAEIVARTYSTLQTADGYKNSSYQGNKWQKYIRIKSPLLKKIQIGITAESDAGEPFFGKPNQTGFDFYSFYASYQFSKILKTAIIGDFRLQHGLGLSMWHGYKNSKGAQTTQVISAPSGLSVYTSTNENNFLRGVATNGQYKNWSWTLFYSKLKTDGNRKGNNISSLSTSGLHRTENEINKKDKQAEQTVGATLAFQKHTFKLSAAYFLRNYKYNIQPTNNPYNQFYFRGKNNQNVSLSYMWSLAFASFAGEYAQSKSGGKAIAQNLNALLSDQLKVTVHYRNIDKDFHSIAGTSFTQSSRIQNETGIYTGIEFLPLPNWQLNAYIDSYKFNWLRYNETAPTTGTDWLLQLKHNFTTSNFGYIRIKHKNEEKSIYHNPIKQLTPHKTYSFRIHYEHSLSANTIFATRLEIKQLTTPNKETGWLWSQTLKWQPTNKLKFHSRIAYFHTPSYHSRIYIYENDALYNFSTPAFWNKGFRFYVLSQFRIHTSLSLWLKLSNTYLLNRDTHGSGHNLIHSPHLSQIKLQLRYRF